VLLRYAIYIVGNSSAGIREAPYYGTPTIDIGSRQKNRMKGKTIVHAANDSFHILKAIDSVKQFKRGVINSSYFGNGNSAELFIDLLESDLIWTMDCQKQFQDIVYE